MRRYMLFTGQDYDKGLRGFDDFLSDFDTIDDAKSGAANAITHELGGYVWAQIVDSSTMNVIARGYGEYNEVLAWHGLD